MATIKKNEEKEILEVSNPYNEEMVTIKLFEDSEVKVPKSIAEILENQESKYPIPRNGGKTIEFRKYDPFPKVTTPISEDITAAGSQLNVIK